MKRDDPEREFTYGAEDSTPDIDALAIEGHLTGPNAPATTPPEPPEVVREATPGSAIPDDPVTDRNGRAPNPPPKGG